MILFENVVGVSESSKDKDGKKFEPPVQAGLSNSLFYNTQNIVRSVAESIYCTVHLCIFKFAYIYITMSIQIPILLKELFTLAGLSLCFCQGRCS